MKAVIYLSVSRKKKSLAVAQGINGDLFQLLPGESLPAFPPFKMFKLALMTLGDKSVPFAVQKIDYSKYDEVVLVFPIWAGRMAQYMKSFIDSKPFENKNITLIATSGSGRPSYLQELKLLDVGKNKVTDIVVYKKDQIQSY